MSDTFTNKPEIATKMSSQLQKDRIIIDIFQIFTNIILSDNSRFKNIMKQKKLKEMIFYYLIDTNRDYEKEDICKSLLEMTKK
jgi:hypothetical protein